MPDISRMAVILTASAGGFTSNLNGAGASVSSFVSTVAGAGSVLAGFAVALGAAGIAAGALAGLTKGIKLASEYEQASVAFETMLGSADKAQQLLGDITKFSAATPFKSDELIKHTQSLLANNVAYDDIIPTLKMLGDVSRGNGEALGGLTLAFTQVRSKGKLAGQEINQFAERGVGLRQELQKLLGVDGAQLATMMEAGAVSSDHMTEALRRMTAEGGKMHGMMAAQSGTLAGLWSTLSENADTALRKVAESIIKGFNLKGLVDSATQWLGKLVPMIAEGAKFVADLVKPILKALVPVGEGLMEVLKGVGMQFAAVIVPAVKLATPLIQVLAQVLGGALTLIGKAMQGMAKILMGVGDALGLTKWKELGKAMQDASKMGAGPAFKAPDLKPVKTLTAAELEAQTKAKKLGEEIAKTNEKLREQVATFGMTAKEAEVYKLKMQGATDAQLAEADALAKKLDAMEKQKKAYEELSKAADKWKEDILTPLEQMEAQLDEINRLAARGLLTDQQRQRAAGKATADFFKAGKRFEFKSPLQRGERTAAVERRFTSGFAGGRVSEIQELAKTAKDQLREAKKSQRDLSGIRRAVEATETVDF